MQKLSQLTTALFFVASSAAADDAHQEFHKLTDDVMACFEKVDAMPGETVAEFEARQELQMSCEQHLENGAYLYVWRLSEEMLATYHTLVSVHNVLQRHIPGSEALPEFREELGNLARATDKIRWIGYLN